MMDAKTYKPGDRVRLVCMDDPYREAPVGLVGTVTGVCPKPANVLDVDWDEPFGLNPCLDVDVVQKVGSVADGREFYTVFTEEGEKKVKYQGFTWHRDAHDGFACACTTISGCHVAIGDGLMDRMMLEAERCQQYQEDMGEREFWDMNTRFFNGRPGTRLHIGEVTADTPDGDYYYEVEGQ